MSECEIMVQTVGFHHYSHARHDGLSSSIRFLRWLWGVVQHWLDVELGVFLFHCLHPPHSRCCICLLESAPQRWYPGECARVCVHAVVCTRVMRVCVCVCVHNCVCGGACVHTYMWACIVCVSMHVCVYMNVWVCVHRIRGKTSTNKIWPIGIRHIIGRFYNVG